MIIEEPFLTLANGKKASLFTLTNTSGMEVKISNLGCCIVSILTPDNQRQLNNVVLQYQDPQQYIKNSSYLGCVVGRFANRINNSEFEINGQIYKLDSNEGKHHLHGGKQGFHHAIWQASILTMDDNQILRLFHISPDGDQGYPGKLLVCVDYKLTDKNELWIEYSAITDKTTHINFTNHSYFNLAGFGTIDNHKLMINSDYILPINKYALPTGEFKSVENSAFDFRRIKSITQGLAQHNPQIELAGGFNHTYVLKTTNSNTLLHAACLIEPNSGRQLDIFSSQPGLLFYSGQCLNSHNSGFKAKAGLCLETQHFPDTPNQAKYPSSLVKPNQVYQQKNCYKFSVIDA